MMHRRAALVRLSAAAAALACPFGARALQRKSMNDPLRVASDDALADSGLASALQVAFAHDTGVALDMLRGPATSVLQALERGEHDVALSNAPALEAGIEEQGLLHDRQLVARSDFVLVGPTAWLKTAGSPHDMALAAAHLAAAQAPFISRADGSGTHLAELALWRAAKLAPAAPWHQQAQAGMAVLSQAREHKACTLVERGVWAAQASSKGYGVLAEGDPRFAIDVHVMRSFRAPHPAGKLFVAWITGAKGRAVTAKQRGYRPVAT